MAKVTFRNLVVWSNASVHKPEVLFGAGQVFNQNDWAAYTAHAAAESAVVVSNPPDNGNTVFRMGDILSVEF